MAKKIDDILQKVWGYNEFRPLQREIIETVISGQDCVGLLPTGGGKSITYQLPALAQKGLVIVITPLIALMRDQVENLRRKHINAIAINSSMTFTQIDAALDNCVYGDVKLLYIAPERIDTLVFRIRLKRMNVSLVAIDEAHCISQWGHDFRPSYLRIASLRETLKDVPFLALTATATDVVLKDIYYYLSLREPKMFRSTFARPNLRFVVRHTNNKYEQLLRIVENVEGSGIVYCRTRKATEDIADFLRTKGVNADFYHAGLMPILRNSKQEDWTKGYTRVIVATNAFGMGIDKSDVRFVIHHQIPESIEAYYQEAGRAGRDGGQSWAVVLYKPQDSQKVVRRIEMQYPPLAEIKLIYEKLHNFLSIGIGEGKEQVFDFSLMDFAAYSKMYSLNVYSALKILELNGYIALTEEVDNPTRIRFKVGRDDLYKYRVENVETDNFLKVLLRTYTGLFSDFVAIDEKYISKISGFEEHRVVKFLLLLSRNRIINYIPRRRSPLIALLEERLPIADVRIAPETYANRRALSELRSLSIIDYAVQDSVCRATVLREYFDEKEVTPCGVCDVCLAKNTTKEESESSFESIREQVLMILSKKEGLTLHALVALLKCRVELALRVIRSLIADGKLKQKADGTLLSIDN